MQTFRSTILFIVCCLGVLQMSAQNPSLTGRVTDAETSESLARATAQLYRIGRDTTFVGGTYSDGQGRFSFNTSGTGSYLQRP